MGHSSQLGTKSTKNRVLLKMKTSIFLLAILSGVLTAPLDEQEKRSIPLKFQLTEVYVAHSD